MSNTQTNNGDAAAIAELRSVFQLQKEAFRKNPYPTLQERRGNIMKLAGMMLSNRQKIHDALVSDFGSHTKSASDLIETLGIAGRAKYVIENLEQWMAFDSRQTDPVFYGTAKAEMRYMPKGVVGNIVPWNFPFELSVGPLCEMLAAGNRVIIKPSEFTPASGQLIKEMLGATFPQDLVYVSLGDVELAKVFPTLKWDHLLYTGSPNVGKIIMRAAAENLTPVTLELGGKCPAIITAGSLNEEVVESVLGTKLMKNGQMCITVDYTLVPRQDVGRFVELAKQWYAKVGDISASEDATGIISERHYERIERLLKQVRDADTQVIDLESSKGSKASRRMPLSLVVDPSRDLDVMKEEIFGPILPIVPYDDLDAAIAEINAGERPLGLYVFSDDQSTVDRVLTNTTSGGACVNTCALQGAMPSLGFGGSGNSGMGKHHGIEGFREFSLARGVVTKGTGGLAHAFYPPFALGNHVADAAFAAATAPAARPSQ